MNHDRAMRLTVREEAEIEGKVQTLHDKHAFEIIELQFLYDALKQVRTCRRVLKWSYVYGYYLEEAGPEKNLFEHVRGIREEQTDHLLSSSEGLDKQFFETALTSRRRRQRSASCSSGATLPTTRMSPRSSASVS
ncbi:unnamed protein product [Prorocentrum cordatum]|uniref:E3 ubiquitin-protein ligase n=1 Tax=Prorocentrum cordatum TaxID=2364126 RepID=A0ABN9QJJ9_9DINO|nr:unnamed protein product [Polarella glacialis]